MQMLYRIGEVEKILGIPRSTIHFYIKKGYLKIDKDESNGYRYYSRRDMREIIHLIVGRSHLHLDLDKSHQRVSAKTLGDFRQLYYTQEDTLVKQIAKDRRSIEILHIFLKMLSRIEKYENRFTILEKDKIHVFAEDYVFQAHTSIIDVGYASSLFGFDGKTPMLEGVHSLVFEEDEYLVMPKDFEEKGTTILPQRYLYTVVKSNLEMEDSNLLQPALEYAGDHNIKIKAPLLLCYLFQVEENGKKQYYYDMYLPLLEE